MIRDGFNQAFTAEDLQRFAQGCAADAKTRGEFGFNQRLTRALAVSGGGESCELTGEKISATTIVLPDGRPLTTYTLACTYKCRSDDSVFTVYDVAKEMPASGSSQMSWARLGPRYSVVV